MAVTLQAVVERGGLGLSGGKFSLPNCDRIGADYRRRDGLDKIPTERSLQVVVQTRATASITKKSLNVSLVGPRREGEGAQAHAGFV